MASEIKSGGAEKENGRAVIGGVQCGEQLCHTRASEIPGWLLIGDAAEGEGMRDSRQEENT